MKEEDFKEALVHLETIYWTAYYLTANHAEAEDLVQDVFLRAYDNWDKYEPGTNCRAWLFKILYNTYINKVKKERHKPVSLAPEELEIIPVEIKESVTDLKKIVEECLDDEIKGAVKKLPGEYIETLVLVWLGDFSYTEAAEILGCPVGTVMSRLYRARALLRKSLADYRKGSSL